MCESEKERASERYREGMNGGDEVVAASADPSLPLEWKFSQVFGERSAGEEVQEGRHRFDLCCISSDFFIFLAYYLI